MASEKTNFNRISNNAVRDILKSPLAKKPKFKREYGKSSPEVRAEELIAKLASGQAEDYGITTKKELAEAERLQDLYAEAFVEANPDADLSYWEKVTNYYEKINQAKENRAKKGKRTGTDSKKSVNAKPDKESSGQERGSPAKEKLSKTPKTVRKAGIPLPDRTYTAVTNLEQIEEANNILDQVIVTAPFLA